MTDQPTPSDPSQASAQAADHPDQLAEPAGPTRGAEGDDQSIVEFGGMGQRVWDVLIRVAGVALAGAVIDGALSGLTFALLGRWFGVFVLLGLGVTAFLTAVHALGGADRAGKRGQRLSSPDVGLSPRKLADGGMLGALAERADAGQADGAAGGDHAGDRAGDKTADRGGGTAGDGPADDAAR